MSDVYYIIGGVAYGIFILQFIISWVAGFRWFEFSCLRAD